ncbi:MAG: hypothetical protein ACRDJL_06950 [Actinomycetota bacterium]
MTLTRQRVILAALIAGALVLEVGLLVWLFSDPNGSDDPPKSGRDTGSQITGAAGCGGAAPADRPSGGRVVATRHFAIEVPQAWDGAVEGEVVTLTKKDGRATLSVGRARPGDLAGALEDLRATLRRTYTHLEVTNLEPLLIDGCPGRSIVGRARNRRAAQLNFEGVVIEGPFENFVIAGFLERGSEPALDAQVAGLIRSVRFSPSGGEPARS